MSARTDIHHGRRGGNWLPDDYDGSPLDDARRCVACGQPIITRGRDRHYVCDPRSIVGRVCVCAPGCTVAHVGDQGSCRADCEVCSLLLGRPYDEVEGWKKSKANAEQSDDDSGDAPAPTLWGVTP